jgi:DNA-directed RNA polymerase subunit M/transcription elongation factor TFIIS
MSFVLPIEVYQDSTYNDLRRGYILLVASLIEEYLIDTEINDHSAMIIAVEKSCFDHSIEIAEHELLTPDFDTPTFEQLYRTRVMRITKNLDINSEVGDEHLAMCLLGGIINPMRVSWLDNQEISPANNAKLVEKLSERLNQKVTLKTSSLYRCPKCGKRETTIRNAQMRSLDEGESAIIQCQYCHYKWFN